MKGATYRDHRKDGEPYYNELEKQWSSNQEGGAHTILPKAELTAHFPTHRQHRAIPIRLGFRVQSQTRSKNYIGFSRSRTTDLRRLFTPKSAAYPLRPLVLIETSIG